MPYRKVDNPVSFIYDQGFYSVDEYPKINLSEDRSGKKLLEERQKFFSGNLDICLFKKKKKDKKILPHSQWGGFNYIYLHIAHHSYNIA